MNVISTDPNVVAVRLGWEGLDDLTASVAAALNADEDHLIGYVPQILTSRKFAWELSHTGSLTPSGPMPLDPEAIPDMLAFHCRRAHQMAAARATSQAYRDDTHRCAVLGVVDDTTSRRWIRCIRQHVQVSDLGEAAIITRWAARNVTTEIGALTDDYLDRVGFTTSTEQPTAPRRKRAS